MHHTFERQSAFVSSVRDWLESKGVEVERQVEHFVHSEIQQLQGLIGHKHGISNENLISALHMPGMFSPEILAEITGAPASVGPSPAELAAKAKRKAEEEAARKAEEERQVAAAEEARLEAERVAAEQAEAAAKAQGKSDENQAEDDAPKSEA